MLYVVGKTEYISGIMQFVMVDIMAYLGLYVAIHYHNWHLRNGSIKLLATIFSAFDRPIYQQLIPRHVYDVLSLPHELIGICREVVSVSD